MKKYDLALTALQHAKDLDPNADELLSALGAVYAQMHEYKKAEEIIREALARNPDHPTNHFNLGVVCLMRKNRDCAFSEYNYLRLKDDPRAEILLSRINSNKVLDASAYKPRQ
jgi:tetratricopeptide (TPR) repeat protein